MNGVSQSSRGRARLGLHPLVRVRPGEKTEDQADPYLHTSSQYVAMYCSVHPLSSGILRYRSKGHHNQVGPCGACRFHPLSGRVVSTAR